MKFKNYFLLLFTVFNIYGIFAQVVTTITDVTLNSQTTINNCGLIDLGTNSNNSLNFYFKLTKPETQAIGTSTLKILLKNNSTSYGSDKGTLIVQSGSWANNKEFISTIQCSISESEIQTTGSSIVLEFTTGSGVKTRSCEYPLKKTPVPSFSFAPTSLSIACGDVSARTFKVTPSNIPSGSIVTYQWNYSGWSGTVNNSMSSITLTPTSTNSVPSSVSVTPYINGVAQAKKTCTVTILSFTSNATISTGTICNVGDTKTYTINGLPSGCNVSWSSTNPAVATVASETNSQVVMQSLTAGSFSIIATITNACGQTLPIPSQNINVGLGSTAPILLNSNCYANSSAPCVINNPSHNSGYVSAFIKLESPTMENNATYSDWEWENISGRFAFSGNWINGNKAYGEYIEINFINNIIPDKIEFRARVRNSCGWSNWKNFIMTFNDGVPVVVPPTTPPTPTEYYNISPNPASSYVNITLKDSSIIPPNIIGLYVSVFTTSGSLVINDTWINSSAGGSLYVGNLASLTGYLLKIKYNNTTETKYLMKN